jgi:hypothetical protein
MRQPGRIPGTGSEPRSGYSMETFRRMLQLLQLERPAVRQIPAGSQQECQAPSLVVRGAHSGHVRHASEQGRRGPLER